MINIRFSIKITKNKRKAQKIKRKIKKYMSNRKMRAIEMNDK